eukprot:Opistho-1_new@73452
MGQRGVLAVVFVVVSLFTGLARAELVWRNHTVYGDVPSPRCDHSAAVYPKDGRIYVFGGYEETHGPYDDLFAYNVATSTWTLLNVTGTTPPARSGAFQGLMGDRFVIGYGLGADGFLNDLFYVDLNVFPLQWHQASVPNPDQGPNRRAYPAWTTYNGRLVFFGGITEELNDQNDMYFLNVTSWEWEKVTYVCANSNLPGNTYVPTTTVQRIARDGNSCNVEDTPSIDTLARNAVAKASYSSASIDDLAALFGDQKQRIGNYSTNATTLIDSALSLLAGTNKGNATHVNATISAILSAWSPLTGMKELAGYVPCGDYFCLMVNCTLPPRHIGSRVINIQDEFVFFDGNQCSTQGTGGGIGCYIQPYYAFNVTSRTWRNITVKSDGSLAKGDVRPPLANFRYPTRAGDVIYDFGGAFRDSAMDWYYYNDVYALNITTWTWSQVSTIGETPPGTWSHVMFAVNGTLVLFGGCRAPNRFYNTVHVLSDMQIHAKYALTVGEGTRTATAGRAARFTILSRDSANSTLPFGGRQVTVFGFDKSGATFQGAVKDHNNGSYDVSFATTRAGVYRMSVTLNLEDVPGSPFDVVVRPEAALAGPSVILGASSFQPMVGVGAELAVAINDQYNNKIRTMPAPFTVTFGGAGAAVPPVVDISVSSDDTYRVTMTFSVPGDYSVSFKLGGVHIGGSPLSFSVTAIAVASSSSTNVGVVAGAVVGAFALFALLAVTLGCLYARRRERAVKADYGQTHLDFSEIHFMDKIGQGSFGEVYKARFRNTIVAVKVIRLKTKELSGESGPSADDANGNGLNAIASPGLFRRSGKQGSGSHTSKSDERASREAREMLAGEIDLMCRLRHPNLLLYMGASSAPKVCVVTEYMENGSVQQLLLTRSVNLPWPRRLSFLLDAARGVAYLHACSPPIIHCDLKSANLLVSTNWIVKVADFGLSRFKRSGKTETFGTLFWMSPEVAAGLACTEKSDTFSFAVMMWEIATRKIPYRGLLDTLKDPEEDFISLLVEKNLRPTVPPNCPSAYAALMTQCWQRNMNKRLSMDEVVVALEDMAANWSSIEGTTQEEAHGAEAQSMPQSFVP